VIEITEGPLVALEEKLKDAQAEYNVAKERLDLLKKEATDYCKDRILGKVKCKSLRITKVVKRGNVNYKKVPDLEGVDLDQYRGKDTIYYKVGFKDD
jgi:hypothetical protein